MFQYGGGDWTQYREFENVIECDFHRADDGPREIAYSEAMSEVEKDTLMALRYAQAKGYRYVLFTHGCSTSSGWRQTTARSVVRGVMRSRESTPYVYKSRSIQHETVFVAAVKPSIEVSPPNGVNECARKIGPNQLKVPMIVFDHGDGG